MRSIKFDQLGRKAELPPSVIAPTASLVGKAQPEPEHGARAPATTPTSRPGAPRPGSESDASVTAGSKTPD